jgi:hypothetical protein
VSALGIAEIITAGEEPPMTNITAEFPLPAGAVRVEEWALGLAGPDGLPVRYRYFSGESWVAVERPGRGDVTIGIEGTQFDDGRQKLVGYVERLDGYEDRLTLAQMRQLRDALTMAIDKLETLSEPQR